MGTTIWTGVLAVGRVTIPVRLVAAAVEAEGRYKSLHRACGRTTTRVAWCEHCNIEITSWNDTARGVEVDQAGVPQAGTGLFAIVEKADLDELAGVGLLRVAYFLYKGDVPPKRMNRHYWVDASLDMLGMRAYMTIVRALEHEQAVAVAPIAIGSKELVACLWPQDGLLVMSTVFRDTEMRPPPRDLRRLANAIEVDALEVKTACELIEGKTRTRLRTTFPSKLDQLVARKAEAGELVGVGNPIRATRNLMRALEQSVPKGR